jgi:hypothetical protein
MPKPYDKNLDIQTKKILEPVYEAILAYLKAQRHIEEPETPSDYKSWDKICALLDGGFLWLEFEVRCEDSYRVWIGPNKECFSERTIHVPERKRDSKADLYVCINPVGSAFAITSMARIKVSPVVIIDAYNEPDMPVFDVPRSVWDFYVVENGNVQLSEISEKERYLILV